MEDIKAILDDIKTGKVRFQLQITEFSGKDAKVDALMGGALTVPAFIEGITDSDPYSLMEVSEETYVVQRKEIKMHIMSRLKSTAITQVWNNIELIKKVYPEMVGFLDNLVKEVESDKCTGCAKNGKAHTIYQEMTYYDNSNRPDLDLLKDMAGRVFIRELKVTPILPRPTARQGVKLPPMPAAGVKLNPVWL